MIIYVRLSREHDTSTSIDSQKAACRAYAEARGWEVLLVAEDVDVSGATRLEDRDGMAEVLDAIPRADYILAAKLDRYARSVLEFSRLLNMTDDSGAILVTADGTLGPETSRLIVHVLSAFAEYERDMIRTRVNNSKAHLRSLGRWLGGAAPYGYRIVRRDGGAYLDLDPESSVIVRECARRIREEGASLTSLMYDLNERGVPSPADHTRHRDGGKPRGTKWSTSTLRDVMTTYAVRGWMLQAAPDGKRKARNLLPVLDEKGEPRKIGPVLLDPEIHEAVIAKLEARSLGAGVERSGKSVVLHVAVCGICGDWMYRQRRTERGKDFAQYLCRTGARRGGHKGNTVNAAGLEHVVENEFLRVLGQFDVMTEVATGGGDVSRELRETTRSIDQLAGNLSALPPGGRAAQATIRQLTALEAKHAELEAQDAAPSGVEYVSTGRTIADEWARRDTTGRNALLREFGVRVTVSPYVPGTPRRFDPTRVRVDIGGPAWWSNDPASAALADAA
ncbi:recombinase family protein [Nocardiopsis aegyptia]|uniref:recombinase family protein n=1 Tax=Nocardiopsis aegyptia TaxID=220378 RepID=UPI00366FF16C